MQRKTEVSPRKEPVQNRSRRMREDILFAAARLLAKEGLTAFNTNRIAEAAGVSIGSLYQYFPNKESLLFCLHERELGQSWAMLEKMLSDSARPLKERVMSVVHAFFESETEELPLRKGLGLAEVYFNEMAQLRAHEAMVAGRLCEIMGEALSLPQADIMLKAHVVLTVVTSVAAHVTDRGATRAEIRRWADECGTMICGYLGI